MSIYFFFRLENLGLNSKHGKNNGKIPIDFHNLSHTVYILLKHQYTPPPVEFMYVHLTW